MNKEQIFVEREWMMLMKEAKNLGVSIQEVKKFLKSGSIYKEKSAYEP
ncbi:anti-repressor SinI family protein [Domibacillus aminovorans]|nr:anti-repressor SinI family protein [Domibacillus aminovorans]